MKIGPLEILYSALTIEGSLIGHQADFGGHLGWGNLLNKGPHVILAHCWRVRGREKYPLMNDSA